MTGKILRRCTICKKFHAAYLVEDAVLGKIRLCYTCWKARQSKSAQQVQSETQGNDQKFTDERLTEKRDR